MSCNEHARPDLTCDRCRELVREEVRRLRLEYDPAEPDAAGPRPMPQAPGQMPLFGG